ncbi:unnamed protein product, partial [Allacma fusca]
LHINYFCGVSPKFIRLSLSKEMLQKPENQRPNCCYRTFRRPKVQPNNLWTADKIIVKSNSCLPIPKSNQILIPAEFLEIFCEFPQERKLIFLAKSNNSHKMVTKKISSKWNGTFATAFPLRTHSKETQRKRKFWKARKSKKTPPSVLILAIESVSRLHSQRVLVQTRDLLLKNDFVELKGYTRVGENTFPNIGAMLSNLPAQSPSCKNSHSTFDNCPYIWKGFNHSNYITGFLEDLDHYSMFHYNKKGFAYQPTDY